MENKKRKIFFVFAVTFFCFSAVYAAHDPGGKARISNSVPGSYAPVSTSGTNYLSKPYPTNKWYNSYLHVQSAAFGTQYTLNAHPLTYKFKNTKYVEIGCPSFNVSSERVQMNSDDYFADISASASLSADLLTNYTTLISSYSDWTATFRRTSNSDNTKWFTTTIGKGLLFSYFNYSNGSNPVIQYGATWSGGFTFYDSSGTVVNTSSFPLIADSLMVKSQIGSNVHYFGIFVPENTQFNYDQANKALVLQFDTSLAENKRLMSVGYIQRYDESAVSVSTKFRNMRRYAYNFVADSKANYNVDNNNFTVKTSFGFTFNKQRTGAGYENGTLIALYPHHWRNISTLSGVSMTPAALDTVVMSTFTSIKGKLKVVGAESFEVTNNFNGILPNFTFEVADADSKFRSYVNVDKNFRPEHTTNPDMGGARANDTYYIGRGLGKVATLVPIFHQLANATGSQEDVSNRNNMIAGLKAELTKWYTYTTQANKYFAYENSWGGLTGIVPSHNLYNYNDHHFHYGYFVYASAVLALFDADFASASEYKGMVDLLVRDFNTPDRNDADFPFLRTMDVYEGHCWASGMGGWRDDTYSVGFASVDQESSGESMNAWAGIYLWGLATNNQKWIDLGIYGYTTEYSAIQEYYYDTTGENYAGFRSSGYNHNSVGILWDNAIEYYVLWRYPYSEWGNAYPQETKGVQVMPATPLMTYLGYDKTYAESFYNAMSTEANNNSSWWSDIWSRFIAFFNPAAASSLLTANESALNSASATSTESTSYTYHFIKFFEKLGNIATSKNSGSDYYVSGSPSYTVMDKSGTRTYMAFNNSTAYKNVNFYSRAGANIGSMKVPPMTTASTKDFADFKYDSLRTMYSAGNNYALLMDVYSDSITVAGVSVPSVNPTYYDTFPFAFSVNAPAGSLNNVKSYVRFSNIPVGSTSSVKLAVYNSGTSLPERPFPSQSLSVESEGGGFATVLIETDLTSAGTYVLVSPTGVQPPGSILISGSITNAKDGTAVSATVNLYNTVDHSTVTKPSNGSYSFDVIEGVNYIITPSADGFMFDPYSFTAGSADMTKDFSALPRYMLSGMVSFNSKAVKRVKVNVYDGSGSTVTVTTGDDGRYVADIYLGKTYTITPDSSEYDFIPESLLLTSVQQSYLNTDFYARIAAGRFVAYPNPYKPSKHGHIGITFAGLKAGAEIKIYNIAGELVFDKKAQSDGPYVWYAENNSGYQAGSGVYIYYIKSGGKTHKGKVAIER